MHSDFDTEHSNPELAAVPWYVSSEVLSGCSHAHARMPAGWPESTSELTYSCKLWVSLFAYSCCLLPANIAEWVLIQQYSENFFLYQNSHIKIWMHTLFLEQFFYLFTTPRPPTNLQPASAVRASALTALVSWSCVSSISTNRLLRSARCVCVCVCVCVNIRGVWQINLEPRF